MKPRLGENASCVRLMVSDTGQGMDPTTKSRMFEPFFTTKEQGKGTGLGLATVYGIVQQAGGMISVRSEPGRGTTFYIYFPRVEGEVTAEAPLPPETPARGSETILVVEDQDGLRALTSEVLRRHGYRVLTAPEGQHALGILQQHAEAVHLLITDLVMPLMGGRELAQRVPRLHPETKLLYISGYYEDQGELLSSGLALLEKPFSPEALLRKVREVLDSPVNQPRAAWRCLQFGQIPLTETRMVPALITRGIYRLPPLLCCLNHSTISRSDRIGRRASTNPANTLPGASGQTACLSARERQHPEEIMKLVFSYSSTDNHHSAAN